MMLLIVGSQLGLVIVAGLVWMFVHQLANTGLIAPRASSPTVTERKPISKSTTLSHDPTLSLLRSDADQEMRDLVDILLSDFCNHPAAHKLILMLNGRLRFKESRTIGLEFLKNCQKSYDIAFAVVYALYHSSMANEALQLLTSFERAEGNGSQFVTWKGFALEKLGRHDEAADNFQRALFLFDDLKTVHVQQFYYATRALRAAGRICDALRPLQLFVSFDQANRSTAQIEATLAQLTRQGNCSKGAQSSDHVVVPLNLWSGLFIVPVSINGIIANLLLDTGATSVHLNRSFAERAKIPLSEGKMVTVQGVIGQRRDFLSSASTVAVSSFSEADVLVTVASTNSALGDGVDGLLGQTFLSRFKIKIDAASRTLELDRRF